MEASERGTKCRTEQLGLCKSHSKRWEHKGPSALCLQYLSFTRSGFPRAHTCGNSQADIYFALILWEFSDLCVTAGRRLLVCNTVCLLEWGRMGRVSGSGISGALSASNASNFGAGHEQRTSRWGPIKRRPVDSRDVWLKLYGSGGLSSLDWPVIVQPASRVSCKERRWRWEGHVPGEEKKEHPQSDTVLRQAESSGC